MTKNLTAMALEKGYRIELEPEYLYIKGIGEFRLPMWFAAAKMFIRPKGNRYNLENFAFKLRRKSDRAMLKAANKEREARMKERELRNEQLRTQRNGN